MSVLVENKDGIFTMTLYRVDKKNAFTNAMYTACYEAVEQAEHDDTVRVVIIKGHASVFSAGNDIQDFLSVPLSLNDSPVFKFMRALNDCTKPIIASVRGVAVGIGTTLLLHCDLVYAGPRARFSMPFSQLGLCPEAASSLIYPMIAGYHRAAEALLLGEMFDVQTALTAGLVNKVLEDEEVEAYVVTQAQKLAALPPSSLRNTKHLLKSHLKEAIARKINEEGELFIHMTHQPEAKEAFTAFTEKRKPDFSKFN